MHELLFHKHPLGNGEWTPDPETGSSGPDKMRHYYNGASGNDNWGPVWHESSNEVNTQLVKEMPSLQKDRDDACN